MSFVSFVTSSPSSLPSPPHPSSPLPIYLTLDKWSDDLESILSLKIGLVSCTRQRDQLFDGYSSSDCLTTVQYKESPYL